MTKCERKLRRGMAATPFPKTRAEYSQPPVLLRGSRAVPNSAQLSVSQLSAPTIISAFRAADRSNLKHLAKRAERRIKAGKLRQNIKKQGGHIALPSAPDFTCAR